MPTGLFGFCDGTINQQTVLSWQHIDTAVPQPNVQLVYAAQNNRKRRARDTRIARNVRYVARRVTRSLVTALRRAPYQRQTDDED
jgi:hypothetical protein